MSTAEITAREVYDAYNIGSLAEDVKRQLIILMLSNNSNDNDSAIDEETTKLTHDQLNERIATAEQDILNGNTMLSEDMETRLESKYPWLCK